MTPKKILFITHDSSRSGAPMLLLYLLQWLKNENKNWTFDLLTLQKGPLDDEYKQAADLYFLYYPRFISKTSYYIKRIFNRNFDFENFYKKQFFEKYVENNYDVIYANTAVSLPMAVQLKNVADKTPKLICNIHELPTVIALTVPNFEVIALDADLFIAGSELVANALQTNYNIPADKIKVVYDFTDLKMLPASIPKIPNSTFVVGAMGAMNWRKGNDLFLSVAYLLKKKYPELDIKFEWIGSQPLSVKVITENDILKANLSADYIQFRNESADYRTFFTKIDLLLLTSREDPFPLVAIEAGAFGLPLITFDKATGINEIITKNNGGGFIIPYLDVNEMVEKIVFYYKNRDLLAKDGALNKQIFKEFTIENSGPVILEIINKHL